MPFQQLILFKENEFEGILQTMIKTNQRNKFAIKVISNVTDANREPEQILLKDDNFYASEYYNVFHENFLIVGFEDRLIYPTGYVLRSSPDFGWLRSWKLECSLLDLYDYKELHSESDKDILQNYQWFPLEGGPCRYIKLSQTSESEGSEIVYKYRMRVSYLDTL